jgi:ECF transporter S component (folate family)
VKGVGMNNKLKLLLHISLLIALEVVLSRFCSIATHTIKIGFGFVPIAISAIMYGPGWAAVAGAMADIIGATLFPIGPYFPGFTVSGALTGAVFGIFLYNKDGGWVRYACAVTLNCIGISLILSTFWLTILTGSTFWALLPYRGLQNLIMIPIQFATLGLLKRPLNAYVRQFGEQIPHNR